MFRTFTLRTLYLKCLQDCTLIQRASCPICSLLLNQRHSCIFMKKSSEIRLKCFWHLCDDRPVSSSSFIRHKVRQSYISRTVDIEVQNFTRTFTPVGSKTTPVMTSLPTSGWQLSKFKKRSKMPPSTDSGGICRERFKWGPANSTRLSWTIGPQICQIWRQ